MNDFLTDDTKAIVLLCGVFGKERSEKPLTQSEYTSLVRWLIGAKMRPGDLLRKDRVAEASAGTAIDRGRLESLLGRGVRLGFAVEQWQRNGIWIVSRSDPDYPARFKKHLKDKAPPLLYGVGDRSLLEGGGLAIVGSRNVDEKGEEFTRRIAGLCASNNMPVVSGGARGVDRFAMTAALEAGGATIGILAENLLKKSVLRDARHAIADGKLLLLSPYHPDARFTVGTAMGRNKLIYAMADCGLVVSAEYKKGGTWAGAAEELKREKPRPVFVRCENGAPSGNLKLLDLGAVPWPEKLENGDLERQLADLAENRRKKTRSTQQDIFDFIGKDKPPPDEAKPRDNVESAHDDATVKRKASHKTPETAYEAVLPVILNALERPLSGKELASVLDVNKAQLDKWLKKAVENGHVRKQSRPVRYVIAEE